MKNIKPARGGEFPEGWDVGNFFKNLYTEEEYGLVVDVGCGYGRLCKAFNPANYLGLDFSSEAITEARNLNPDYTFCLVDSTRYPLSRTKLLYTVLLHQTDEDISKIVKSLCESTDRIIVAEICGRKWRRAGNPPVFNREYEEYVDLFSSNNKAVEKSFIKPYNAYKNTNIHIMVFA